MSPALETFLSEVRDTTDSALHLLLSSTNTASQHRLIEAMRYAVLNGGKRIRPALCFAAASLQLDSPSSSHAVVASACALELIHAYSLVHDDLPAMDDDDLRRGKPTAHIAFDEATAILAGDALQTLAFEALVAVDFSSVNRQIACLRELAVASGAQGMCGGQMIDLEATGQPLALDALETMHRYKTGALIRASVRIGAIASGNEDESALKALTKYAEALGLAFQVKDDILDATSDTATLGKRQGADAERNKPTYVSLLGVDGAQQKLKSLHDEALLVSNRLGESAKILCDLADYVVLRHT